MNVKTINAKNILLAAGLITLLAATSCKKYVDLNTPPDSVGADEAFSDSSTATSVVLGIYAGMASANGNNGTNSIVFFTSVYGAMSADEGYYPTNTTYDAFETNTLAAGNSANVFWNAMYTRISRANYAIEGINGASKL